MEVDKIYQGHALEVLKTFPDQFVNCIVTSPPYYGLRDYGHDDQIGLESTPEKYINNLTEIFEQCRRVLKNDGTLWLNLGDSYTANWSSRKLEPGNPNKKNIKRERVNNISVNLKSKDLIGIPWRAAFALQAAGWYLRSDIIWNKPNAMPESVADRPTKSHEYIFLLSKNEKYFYDNKAIREPLAISTLNDKRNSSGRHTQGKNYSKYYDDKSPERIKADKPSWYRSKKFIDPKVGRNKRTVWKIKCRSYSAAHFAVYPEKLIEPCVKAGTEPGGIVLDPFFGSGTTGLVSKKLGRHYIGIEINPDYIQLAENRIKKYTDQVRFF